MEHKVHGLVALVQEGRFLEALDAYYAENVSMAENLNAPMVGKDLNRLREIEWVNTIRELIEYRAESIIVDGDKVAIHWISDYIDTDGNRIQMDQWAIQQWRDGKVSHEQFVYDPGSVKVAA